MCREGRGGGFEWMNGWVRARAHDVFVHSANVLMCVGCICVCVNDSGCVCVCECVCVCARVHVYV